MSQSKLSPKELLVLLVAVPAVLIIAGVLLFSSLNSHESAANTKRGPEANQPKKIVDAAEALREFRRVHSNHTSDSQRLSGDVHSARTSLLKLGDDILPALRNGIYSSAETPRFRMEMISLLAEMKGAAPEALLVSVFADVSLEDRYRALAVTRLCGRQSDAVFAAIRRSYVEEPDFAARYLVIKALGDCRRSESSPLLLEAATREVTISARVQAIDSLGTRVGEPGVSEALKTILFKDPDENVRVASVASLGKDPAPWVDSLLREIGETPEMSSTVRASARSWLDQRSRK